MTVRTFLLGAVGTIGLAAGAIGLMRTALPALTPWTLDPTDPHVPLADVETEVRRRFPVPDVSVPALEAMIARGDVTLFDVRTQEEFAAGHLPGAIRVEPDFTVGDILDRHRDRLSAGPVIFYCAVGVRSSRSMMATLRDVAPHAGAGLYNLRGGIFRWTAEGRALVKGDGPGEPHPFDENWGRLLARTLAR